MINLNIQPLPNQTFSALLDNKSYEITLRSCDTIMCVSISRDEEVLISNVECVVGTPLLPYAYQENGNFMFLTLNDDLPDYTQFGNTQQLIFASEAELEAIYNG